MKETEQDCDKEVENNHKKPRRKKHKLSFKKTFQYNEYPKWLYFYPTFGRLKFEISPASYFDERAQLHTHLTTLLAIIGFTIQLFGVLSINFTFLWVALFLIPWGNMFLNFPIYSGKQECEHPSYGFYLFSETSKYWFNTFVWCWGMKTHHSYMFWSWDWVRTSMLLNTGEWEHETKGNRRDFYKDEWKFKIYQESHPYTYILKSGKVQERTATLKVEEREWRWRGLKFLGFPKKVRKTIWVEFDLEVGERTGTWKGGTTGCGYLMLHNELPVHTLRRMEKERKFN